MKSIRLLITRYSLQDTRAYKITITRYMHCRTRKTDAGVHMQIMEVYKQSW